MRGIGEWVPRAGSATRWLIVYQVSATMAGFVPLVFGFIALAASIRGNLAYNPWVLLPIGAVVGAAAGAALSILRMPYNFPAFVRITPTEMVCHPSGNLSSQYTFQVRYDDVLSAKFYTRGNVVGLRLKPGGQRPSATICLALSQASALFRLNILGPEVVSEEARARVLQFEQGQAL